MPHTNEVSKITNREIKAEALRRLKGNWGNCIALTVFILAFIFFLALCEAMLYLLLALFDAREYYFMSFMIRTRPGRFGIVFRLVLLFALIMPELYIARRLYIDIANGKSFVKSRRYIQSNLQQQVENFGMSLFYFVQKQNRVRSFSHRFGKLSSVVKAHISWRRADKL